MASVFIPKQIKALTSQLRLACNSGEYCDALVVAKDGVIKAHCVVLGSAHPELHKMLMSCHISEGQKRIFFLEYDKNTLQEFMNYLYTGCIHITPDNMAPLIKLMKNYDMHDVLQATVKYLGESTDWNYEVQENPLKSDSSIAELMDECLVIKGHTCMIQRQTDSGVIKLTKCDILVPDIACSQGKTVSPDIACNQEKTVSPDINACNQEKTVSPDINACSREKTVSPLKKTVRSVVVDIHQSDNPCVNDKSAAVTRITQNSKRVLDDDNDPVDVHGLLRKGNMEISQKQVEGTEVFDDGDITYSGREQDSACSNKRKGTSKGAFRWGSFNFDISDAESGSSQINAVGETSKMDVTEVDTDVGDGISAASDAQHDCDVSCKYCQVTFPVGELKQHKLVCKNKWACAECMKTLTSEKLLLTHMKNKHGISLRDTEGHTVYKCQFPGCKYETLLQFSLHSHSRSHENVGRYPCDECKSVMKSRFSLKRHKATVHPAKASRVECDRCGKQLKNPGILEKHKRQVHAGLSQLCAHCPYQTRDKKTLENHMNKEHAVPFTDSKEFSGIVNIILADDPATKLPGNLQCCHCSYKTRRKNSYTNHMRRHTGELPFQCEQCGKRFPCKSDLTFHGKWHKDKTHKCTFEGCKFAAVLPHKLQEHILCNHTHRHVKPFICEICDYRTNRRPNLILHIRNVHKLQVQTKKHRVTPVQDSQHISPIVDTGSSAPSQRCLYVPSYAEAMKQYRKTTHTVSTIDTAMLDEHRSVISHEEIIPPLVTSRQASTRPVGHVTAVHVSTTQLPVKGAEQILSGSESRRLEGGTSIQQTSSPMSCSGHMFMSQAQLNSTSESTSLVPSLNSTHIVSNERYSDIHRDILHKETPNSSMVNTSSHSNVQNQIIGREISPSTMSLTDCPNYSLLQNPGAVANTIIYSSQPLTINSSLSGSHLVQGANQSIKHTVQIHPQIGQEVIRNQSVPGGSAKFAGHNISGLATNTTVDQNKAVFVGESGHHTNSVIGTQEMLELPLSNLFETPDSVQGRNPGNLNTPNTGMQIQNTDLTDVGVLFWPENKSERESK